jgi:hypothetical protein
LSTNEITADSTRPKKRRIGLVIAGTIMAGLLLVGGLVLGAAWKVADAIPTPEDFATAMAPQPYEEISPAVITSIRELAELTTVEMTEYSIVEKGTDEGWLQWARGDSVRLMAVARIGAGVDLAGLTDDDITVSETGRVSVTLPQAEIHYVAIDEEATQVLGRDKGLFTKGDPQLESEARRIAETKLSQAALDNGILVDAEDSAVSALTSLLIGLGYSDVVVDFSA